MNEHKKNRSKKLRIGKLWGKEYRDVETGIAPSTSADQSPLSDGSNIDVFSSAFENPYIPDSEPTEASLTRHFSTSTAGSASSSLRRQSIASSFRMRRRPSSSSSMKSDGNSSLCMTSDSLESTIEPLSPISSEEEADIKAENTADAIANAILEQVSQHGEVPTGQKWVL